MRKRTNHLILLLYVVFLSLASLCWADVVKNDSAPRSETILYSEWTFYKGDYPDVKNESVSRTGRNVTVPHDWQIEKAADPRNKASQGFFEREGIGWYRREFTLDEIGQDFSYQIHFDRIFDRSEIFVNGISVGSWMYGYMSFSFDITDFVKQGKNVLAVRVDNSKGWDSRWYSGAGITGDVKLIKTGRNRIKENGINIVSNLNEDYSSAEVLVSIELEEGSSGEISGILSLHNQSITANSSDGKTLIFKVPNPELWNTDHPVLYNLEISLSQNGKITDRIKCKTGIRKVEFISKKGLFVNGKFTKLKGGCLHIDGGGIGAAAAERSWRRRLQGLKEVGVNAIRCSHNPYPPIFYELCDEMGFYVFDEVWDKWNYPYVTDDWERILHDFIARDRKYTCVISWSVGNEVADQGGNRMIATLSKFTDYVKKMDPTRPVSLALIAWYSNVPKTDPNDNRSNEIRAIGKILEHVDFLMLNYQEFLYESIIRNYPDALIVGSEVYQYFSAANSAFVEILEENPWNAVMAHNEVIGSFQWTAVSYLGESKNWPLRGWANSLIRTDDSREPISWLLQSFWDDKLFVKLAVLDNSIGSRGGSNCTFWSSPLMTTHWNYAEGQALECAVFSNCDEIEIKVNDTRYPKKRVADYTNRYVRMWIKYIPGTITVSGFKNGKKVCEDVIRTAGNAARLRLTANQTTISSNRYDLCYFRVEPVDKNNRICEQENKLVTLSITGPGEIIAVDNGDLMNSYNYTDQSVPLFRGGATVVVKATPGEIGEIKVKAEAEGMTSAEAAVQAVSDSIIR